VGCCTLRWLGKTHFSRLDLVSIFCYPLEKQRAFPFLYALFCSKSVSVRFTTVARLGANSGLTCHNWLASATNMLPFLGFFFWCVCVCYLEALWWSAIYLHWNSVRSLQHVHTVIAPGPSQQWCTLDDSLTQYASFSCWHWLSLYLCFSTYSSSPLKWIFV